MLRTLLAVLASWSLASWGADAASSVVGFWRIPTPQKNSNASDSAFSVRKSGEIYVVEVLEHDPMGGGYSAREYPATLRDGILRVAVQGSDIAFGFDAERGTLVGGVCRNPCSRIDQPTYASLKRTLLEKSPGGIPRIDFNNKNH